MFNKNVKKLKGKTIQSINTRACNVWKVTFTDGSKVEIWGENDGPCGIAQIWLDEYKELDTQTA